MRKLLLVFLVLGAPLLAQTVVPQTPNETLNLAPRCKRGEAQVYSIKVEVLFLDSAGNPATVKNNRLDYTQLCLTNNPDSGLIYDITVDSFSVGTLHELADTAYIGRAIVDSLMGMNFHSQFRSKIPVMNNCCDFGIPLTTGFPYVEAWEFIDAFLPAKIMEQLHYTVGRRLSKVGDTATIVWPKPICYSIKKVINESRLELTPCRLTVMGLTNYRGTPCAAISVTCAPSPFRVEVYSTPSTSFKWSGTSKISGEFLVSLRAGNIVYARMSERQDLSLVRADLQVKTKKVQRTTELIPRVW
jgi:hypothetical protein